MQPRDLKARSDTDIDTVSEAGEASNEDDLRMIGISTHSKREF